LFQLLLIAVAGFVAQLIDGSLGMGYGVTSTTLLLTVGLTPALASASVHLAEIGTSGVSGASHWRLGNVDLRVLLLLGIPGGIGAFFGAVVLSNLSLDAARPWVSVVLLVLGGVILFRFLHARRTKRAPAALHDSGHPSDPAAPASPLRTILLAPLGIVGGFLDASGGGGWGPVTTSTLMASGRLRPRTIIGTVSGSEFIVSIAASIGFLLALGSSGIQWDIVAMLLIGGSIAAPISAWLVRHFDDRALGTAVGGLIVLINLDRVLLLLGFDSGIVTATRLVVIALAVVIILALIARGRARTEHEASAAAAANAITPATPAEAPTR
jgi:uncharacterized membrane protein YfcA